MPNNFDFSKLENVKLMKINLIGWISPLYVEYGIAEETKSYGGTLSYFWRVKGTEHTFIIPIVRMDYLSSGNYKMHFEKSLEVFREDYIEWHEQNFSIEWMKEYEKQFSQFIII